jgi:hypothetical protein
MGTRRGEKPPTREIPQALLEPERPDRQRILEPDATAQRQRLTTPCTASHLELQPEPRICGVRLRDTSTRHPPAQPQRTMNGPILVTKTPNGPH